MEFPRAQEFFFGLFSRSFRGKNVQQVRNAFSLLLCFGLYQKPFARQQYVVLNATKSEVVPFVSDNKMDFERTAGLHEMLSVSACVCLSAAPKFYLVSFGLKHLTRICIIQQSAVRHAHSLCLAPIQGHSASLCIFTAFPVPVLAF